MDTEARSCLLTAADHAEAGRTQEAENAFAAAVLQDPALHIARFQLGLLQWSGGRPGAALVTWQPLAELPPGMDLGHFARAFMLWSASDMPGAADQFSEGIACCANAALVNDMKVLRDALVGPQASAESAKSAAEVNHVLLANYVSAGRAH